MMEHYHLDGQAARSLMAKEDQGRAHYLRRYFAKDIDDPLLYHMILNTDKLSFDEAARLVAEAVLERSQSFAA
jgi:cytidylate kinase